MKHSYPDVSRETLQRLAVFAELLSTWNRRINLVSRDDELALWKRHILDALQLVPHLPPVRSALDLGSGGGIPGMVLAIATEIPFTLVDSDVRKCAFLREAARVTRCPATIINKRIENLGPCLFPLVTARALARLPQLLSYATPHLNSGGMLLLLKGANVETELIDAEKTWKMHVQRHSSETSEGGVILRITEVTRA